jgi:dTDP-glucose 4,6-dehydratase
MQHILVTGGAGFIGSNFVHYLLAHDPAVQIVTLDALTYAGQRQNLADLPDPSRHTFVHGDINDRELVLRLLREHTIDTVVHFAAETHVDRSILGPGTFVQTNIVGTFNLLEAARQVWLEEGGPAGARFHHVSTDEVFGSLTPDEPAWDETAPYAPNSPYAASKAASDHLVRSYQHTYGLPTTISNCSNNYGPRQFPEKLIPLMILNALSGRPLPIYGDGQQVRDWLYVDDHCAAIDAILRRGQVGETYNIGGDNQPTNLLVVQTLCALLDEEFQPEAAPHTALMQTVKDRPGHDRRYAMDSSKLQRELGWRPQENLASGLRRTIAWMLAHPDWLAAVQGGDYQGWLDRNYTQR